jgi:hypoxanthine phosphoribosyltransferase
MAEDAYTGKRILIVDDINDSGATLNWIKQDWSSGCLPGHPDWNNVWGNNVRVAVLVDNESSKSEIPVSYSAVDLNKAEQDSWIVFPWEDWWK